MSSLISASAWFNESTGINKASAETTINGRPARVWYVTKQVGVAISGDCHKRWQMRCTVKAHEGIDRQTITETHYFYSFKELREGAAELTKNGFTTQAK